MFQMMGVFAEFERAMIQERVRAGLARARSEGKRLGRPPIAPALEKRIREALATPGRPGIRVIAERLAAKGYMARGGQIIDASIVPVPTQRNSRDENAELQAGRTPAGWKQKPPKCGRRTAMRAGPRSMAAASSATRTM
jgi:hypothetical protein